jgi:hypothetical protein
MTYVSLFKRHVIALLYRYALAIVVVAIVGEKTTWRQSDGDHGVKRVTMEIMPVPQDGYQGAKRYWPYHVTYELHVMLILLCILFCLGRR